MTTIGQFAASFSEEPGYFDFARIGPVGEAVMSEENAQLMLVSRARFGSLDALPDQSVRVRSAVASVIGYRADQIAFQPNTTQELLHVMAGIGGQVAVASSEVASLTVAAERSAHSTGHSAPLWLETDHGRITPGNLRSQLTSAVVAVAVSLVDFRTGHLADIEGIRQVIGDRLLIVDAGQGFGVVDAPYEFADVVVSVGHSWVRAGWGTGFVAMSDRAVDRITPIWSGFTVSDAGVVQLDELEVPAIGASEFSITSPDPAAEARLAAALEQIDDVGVPAVQSAIADKVSRIIDMADEFVIPVVSSRDESERAGIVVLEPPVDHLTMLSAALFNHGVTATTRGGRVRLSAHVSTNDESIEMLRAAVTSYASVVTA